VDDLLFVPLVDLLLDLDVSSLFDVRSSAKSRLTVSSVLTSTFPSPNIDCNTRASKSLMVSSLSLPSFLFLFLFLLFFLEEEDGVVVFLEFDLEFDLVVSFDLDFVVAAAVVVGVVSLVLAA